MNFLRKTGVVGVVLLAMTLQAFSQQKPLQGDAASIRARELFERMQQDGEHVVQLQQLARKSRDVIKLNCVNDKLVQIKPLLNTVDQSRTELDAISDPTQRATAVEAIQNTGTTVQRLREAADQCVGEGSLSTDSANDYTGPQFPLDPFAPDNGGGGGMEPPGYASPIN